MATPGGDANASCNRFCCSKYLTFDDTEATNLLPTLKNPIHPVFHRERFRPDFDYDTFKLALRLASRLLVSPAAIPFINLVIDGKLMDEWDREHTWAEIDTSRRQCAAAFHLQKLDASRRTPDGLRLVRKPAHAEHEVVNRENTASTRQILRDFAGLTCFRMHAFDNKGLRGRTLSPRGARHVQAFPHGRESTILISQKLYIRARDTLLALQTDPSKFDASTVFAFVKVLMHELGHALVFAGGSQSPEFCYKDLTGWESGFVFEAMLFGGLLHENIGVPCFVEALVRWWTAACETARKRKLRRGLLSLVNHPAQMNWRAYEAQPRWRGTRTPEFDVAWRVPRSWVDSLFTNAFWQQVTTAQHPAAQQAPRVPEAMWIFTTGPGQSARPVDLREPPWHLRAAIEKLICLLG